MLRLLAVTAAVALLSMAVAACSDDDDDDAAPQRSRVVEEAAATQAAATEAPTEATTPEPTEPPAPSATQPAAGLEDLTMTAVTTGQDVLDHVSEAEVACARDAMGAAAFEAFAGAEVVAVYRDANELEPLFDCLMPDNFVVFGMLYVGARAGGFELETQTCLLALGREHPDAVVTILGVEPPEAVAALFADTHNYVSELYSCLNTQEKVELTVHMWNELGAYSLPASELMSAFTEEEITCFTESFGVTREQLEQMLASRPPGQTSTEATPCITLETYGRIIIIGLTAYLGGITKESASCVQTFATEHIHFLELARVGIFDPDMMSEAEFEEIASDGLVLFGCLTDDELKSMQELAAHALGSFGRAELQ